ncbi:hypothetical protein Q8A67_006647 [Cirrhinus molitorella]|uniref:Ig-like domain-containing protein n=1 Tax=Cirrhinus molitorella TaxID=172907 RepID=A0AA88PXQ6_9TELE|nr:hypothetical protein Q8A67_006647 [Cirrhinus molitorella]
MESKETGFAGKDVLLSCNCSDEHNELVWQKGMRVLNIHPQDESAIDVSYKNRTQLFLNNEKRNCSLLIRNITKEDEGLYSCHALGSSNTVYSRKQSDVFLTDDSAVGQSTMKSKETGFVGKDVLLSCNCSDEHNELVWQKGMSVLNTHPQEESAIDVSYKNRTQLFLNNENGNCSLLIRNITKEDEGLYTCHALASSNTVYSRKQSDVFLTVSTYVSTERSVPEPEVDQGVHRLRISEISQRAKMVNLTLLTLLLITSSSAVGKTITSNQTGFVGKDVLLSCNCSDEYNELVWQKGMTVLNTYPQDESAIDVSYKNRTQLFLNNEKRNCSLLIHNITKEDEGLYTCHALASVNTVYSRKQSDIFLTVSEKVDVSLQPYTDSVSAVSPVSIGVPILVVVLILAVSLLLTLLIRRRHPTITDTDLRAEEPMLETV